MKAVFKESISLFCYFVEAQRLQGLIIKGHLINHPKYSLTYIITFIIFFITNVSQGQVKDSLIFTVPPQITLLGEYDNNVDLVNNENDDLDKDLTLHLLPQFGLLREHNKHKFGLALESDIRHGISNTPLQAQLKTSGSINMRFNNGFQLNIGDYYMMSDFDQGLKDLPGILKRKLNNFQSKLSYTPVKRLNVNASFNNRWFVYKNEEGLFERISNTYGTGASYAISERFKIEGIYKKTLERFDELSKNTKRTIDFVDGKFTFPLATAFGSYINYSYKKQHSPDLPARNFADSRYIAGLTWQGPNRFFIWIEGGYEEILYDSVFIQNYFNPVGEVGGNLKFSENITGKIKAGIDVYSNFRFDAELDYKYSEIIALYLATNRKTETYFLTDTPKDTYISSNYILELKAKLTEVMKMELGASYITRDDYSDDVSIPSAGKINRFARYYIEVLFSPQKKLNYGFEGSYLVQDSDTEQSNIYQYNTWVGKIIADYLIIEKLRIGAHYQYSTRNSTQYRYDFNNTRVGLYATLFL